MAERTIESRHCVFICGGINLPREQQIRHLMVCPFFCRSSKNHWKRRLKRFLFVDSLFGFLGLSSGGLVSNGNLL